MLVYFSAENFRSINEPIELNLRAAPRLRRHSNHVFQPSDDKKLKVLKSALLYGANASGKSNIIKAISFAKDLITSPQGIKQPIQKEPFLFNEESKTESSFYFEFIAMSTHFGFGVKFDRNRIIEESLYIFDGETEHCIYTRTTNKNNEVEISGKIIDDWPVQTAQYLQEFKFIAKYTAPNKLFLTEIEEKALVEKLHEHNDLLKTLAITYIYFKYQLVIIYPHSKYLKLMDLVDNQKTDNILNGLDTSIKSLGKSSVAFSMFPSELQNTIQESLTSKNYYPFMFKGKSFQAINNGKKEIEVFHIYTNHGLINNQNVTLELAQESDGTQRLIDLIAVFGHDAREDLSETIIIDEFDRSLHPNLAKKYLELFLNDSNQNQLIATTHQSELLDNNLLRRDEIWFVQKEWDQSTKLYSLNDYSTRFDKDIHKAYLEGKFGAVPVISDDLLKTKDKTGSVK